MLEHVTAHQMRFVTPGLSADPRGVALGRFSLSLLPSPDRMFGFFRGLSRLTCLDDVLHDLRIVQVVTPLGSHEYLAFIPVNSSHAADGIAQVTRLNGGLTFTGTTKHFVQFRDNRSPLGYDADRLIPGDGDDLVLYARDFQQGYRISRELAPDRLLLEQALVPVAADRLRPSEEALLRVRPGLWRAILGYLHRNHRPCSVALCEREGQRRGPEEGPLYLMRTSLEPRMETLFRETPGVTVFRFKTERAAVELGSAHPLELSSVQTLFNENKLYLFYGYRGEIDIIDGPPVFVDAQDLVTLPRLERPAGYRTHVMSTPRSMGVSLRLVRSPGTRPAVKATLLKTSQAPWLKKLVYLLPPQALESTRICLFDDEILLYNDKGLDLLPLGEPFYELGRGVLLPLGYELEPRVHPDVLLLHLGRQSASADAQPTGASGGHFYLFSPERTAPLYLPRGTFAVLSRRILADVPLHAPRPRPLPVEPEAEQPSLVNEPAGAFPLWGFEPGGGEGEP